MYLDDDLQHIREIGEAAEQIWGDNCVFGELQDVGAPWCEFNWPARINGKHDIVIYYDRSIVSQAVMVNGERLRLRDLTNKQVIRSFPSSKPENLLHNFRILDEVLRDMEK